MELESVVEALERMSENISVPKNIRKLTQEAADNLKSDEKDLSVRINSAVSILDEVSEDPNLPLHVRTELWNIASTLETLSSKTES